MDWRPPSTALRLTSGVWEPATIRALSYPDDGNQVCLAVEDASYWFAHRNACILEAMRLLPPCGELWDVGGGNGYVSMAMQKAGYRAVLLEPGPGAFNAAKRGISRVVHSSLEDAHLARASIAAIGAFDVIEHIEDHAAFVAIIHDLLRARGRFYCTVPASNVLWSAEDVHAGHFRRYTAGSLSRLLRAAGFEIEFLSPLFCWLIFPVLILRAIPYRMGVIRRNPSQDKARSDHTLPGRLARMIGKCHAWELGRLARRSPLPCGTSLLCVARRA